MTTERDSSAGLFDRMYDYQPTKAITAYAVAGAVVAVLIAGFGSGAWVTSGKASEIARQAASSAHTELAATWCVDRFLATQDAAEQLSRLKEMRSRVQRTRFLQAGDWTVLPGGTVANRQIAARCGDVLVDLQLDDTGIDEAAGLEIETDQL